jgi:hypothetical protein
MNHTTAELKEQILSEEEKSLDFYKRKQMFPRSLN